MPEETVRDARNRLVPTMAVPGIYACSSAPESVGVVVTGTQKPETQPKASLRRERSIEKKRLSDLEWAEKMKPRLCRLCKIKFSPTRRQDHDSTFCTAEHRKAFWKQAHQIAAGRMTAGEFFADANRKAYDAAYERKVEAEEQKDRAGMSDNQRVLELLMRNVNRWVSHPYRQLSVMWHSRVSDLRKKGHQIDMRVVYDKSEKRNQYEYMLVVNPEGE